MSQAASMFIKNKSHRNLYLMAAYTFPKSDNNSFETFKKLNQKMQREAREYIIKIKGSTLWERETERL